MRLPKVAILNATRYQIHYPYLFSLALRPNPFDPFVTLEII
jgi:hypothetical protein